jgi:hypothetical protein
MRWRELTITGWMAGVGSDGVFLELRTQGERG